MICSWIASNGPFIPQLKPIAQIDLIRVGIFMNAQNQIHFRQGEWRLVSLTFNLVIRRIYS